MRVWAKSIYKGDVWNDRMTGPIGKIYSLDEAAEYMRIGKRQLAKVAKANGLCSVVGREILFSEDDIRGIWDFLRAQPPTPAIRGKARVSNSDKAFERLLARATEQAQKGRKR